jgi:hypothetical protein
MEKERLNIHDDLSLSTWSGKRKQKIEKEDKIQSSESAQEPLAYFSRNI